MESLARRFWQPGTLVVAAIVASYMLVWPVGEYTILDDWAYVKSLEHLHKEGRLHVLDWNPMSLIGQLFWAWPFTKVFGFSFTVARLSVVILHMIECLALVGLLRLCEISKGLVIAAVATLVFNPLHFLHSFTFMTDVPAVAWQTIAALCYARAIARGVGQPRWLACGSAASGIAFLIRQSGVLMLAAFLAYAILFDRSYLRWKRLVAALGPVSLAVVSFNYWYFRVHGATSTFKSSSERCLAFLLHPQPSRVVYLSFAIATYVGFFLCPLSLTLRYRLSDTSGKARLTFGLIAWTVINLFAYYYAYDGQLFPYFINVINRCGYFTANEFILGERDVVWGDVTQWVFSIAVMASLLALANRFCGYRWHESRGATPDRVLRLLLLLLALEFLYCFATAPILFDRHLLVLAPTAIAVLCLLCRDSARPMPWAFAVAIAPFVFYSIAASHDVHAISRTAFEAGDALIAEGIDPKFIDGGYAFDGWYMYERSGKDARPRPAVDPWWLRELMHGVDDEYAITLSPSFDMAHFVGTASVVPGPSLKDREVVKSYIYRGFWPWKTQHVYVMKRRSAAGSRKLTRSGVGS